MSFGFCACGKDDLHGAIADFPGCGDGFEEFTRDNHDYFVQNFVDFLQSLRSHNVLETRSAVDAD